MDEEVTPEEIEEMINMCSINGTFLFQGKWPLDILNAFESCHNQSIEIKLILQLYHYFFSKYIILTILNK